MSFDGKRILLVSPDFPYPPNHGGRLDIWQKTEALARLGFEIDMVATVKGTPTDTDVQAVRSLVRNVTCCDRSFGPLGLLSPYPMQVKSREGLKSVKLGGSYDIVLMVTPYVISILDNPRLKATHRILRVANDEAKYSMELSRTVGLGFRQFYWLESRKFRWLESRVKRDIPNMLFISYDEHSSYEHRNPQANSAVLPATAGTPCRQDLSSRNVLFVGSLFMPNNRQGLLWYLSKVHPLLSDIEDYRLLVAGNSQGKDLGWLHALVKQHGNVSVFDSPKDLTSLYNSSSVFVNPMLRGAGVKIKTIEAIQMGLPVVSTTTGNQGTGLQNGAHILVTDDPGEFAGHVRSLLSGVADGRALVCRAQDFISDNYDDERILGGYLRDLLASKVSVVR